MLLFTTVSFMTLALFDFDGTITAKDSLEAFTIFARGAQRYYLGLLYLSPVLLLYKLKIIPNYRAKEIFLAHFFKGMSHREFSRLGREYALCGIDKIVRKKALQTLKKHQQHGDTVVIVSASAQCWLEAWCRRNGIALIATTLAFPDGIFNGRLQSKNCYGIEKVNRLKARYDLKAFDTIYAYGDSEGDRELLALATHAFYKPFR
ncbi:MAG: HAD-IB family hydrolase [Sulfurimonas sp.]|nr:MAG: HAD-IB family hydrolase [Sulfurimonas sp.]